MGELSDKPKFSFENNNSLTEATVFNLTGENLKSLLLILNSNLCQWYFETFTTTSGMGTNRWKKYKMEKIPLPKILDKEVVKLNILSDYLIYLNNPKNKQLLHNEVNEEVSNLFEKIANLAVYELYFSEELIAEDVDIINLIDFKDISYETDEEKGKTILNTYYDLLGKNNEIRNRVLVSESRCDFIQVINKISN